MSKIRLAYWLLPFFALFVVILGAYTRLTNSGMGCPDWPGCYGQLTVVHSPDVLMQATSLFPHSHYEHAKAWPEMAHRYFAGLLGLIVVLMSLRRIARMGRSIEDFSWLPFALVILVVAQAAFGMWTVTWSLHPLAVMPHLIGGMLLLASLFWQALDKCRVSIIPIKTSRFLRFWTALTLIFIFLQMALGGWTSSHYAALSCPDFPLCQGQWWPNMNWQKGFSLLLPQASTYEYGILDLASRTAIHMSHRLAALLLIGIVAILIWRLQKESKPHLERYGFTIVNLLVLQIIFGIANILGALPLLIATTHNGVAALLMISTLALYHDLYHVKHHPSVPESQ